MPSLWERRRRVKAASSTTIDHPTDKARQATARPAGSPGGSTHRSRRRRDTSESVTAGSPVRSGRDLSIKPELAHCSRGFGLGRL